MTYRRQRSFSELIHLRYAMHLNIDTTIVHQVRVVVFVVDVFYLASRLVKEYFELLHTLPLVIQDSLQDVKLIFDILGFNDKVDLTCEAEVLVSGCSGCDTPFELVEAVGQFLVLLIVSLEISHMSRKPVYTRNLRRC